MTSIVELFPKCRKLAYDARQQLAVIQQQQQQQQQPSDDNYASSSGSSSNYRYPATSSASSISELYMVLDELNKQLDCMDELVLSELPEQRMVWKRKIYEIRQEIQTIRQQGYQMEMSQKKISSYTNDRNELLRQRKKKGSIDDNNNNSTNHLQNLTEESTSLQQSQYMVTNIIQQGQSNLYQLIEQRQKLYGVNRIMASIDDRLGITAMTMKIIERRDITDAYFVVVGMIITCLVIYFAWF
jgi:golgi SNAP receptor complex member 2